MIDATFFTIKFAIIIDIGILLSIINCGVVYLIGCRIFLWIKKQSDKMEDKYLNRRREEE